MPGCVKHYVLLLMSSEGISLLRVIFTPISVWYHLCLVPFYKPFPCNTGMVFIRHNSGCLHRSGKLCKYYFSSEEKCENVYESPEKVSLVVTHAQEVFIKSYLSPDVSNVFHQISSSSKHAS